MGYKIGMISLGCPKNQTDAEIMLGILADYGHEIVNDPNDADIIIVNTCGFIESAKQESIETILEMSEYKSGKCKLVIATGCMAERYNEELLKEMPEVDAVVGTGDYHKIAKVIDECLKGKRPLLYSNKDYTPEEGLPRILTTPNYTAYLKIADGCDNNCTYCAIPKIRGKFRSRTIEAIYDEAIELSKNGVRELIIIAQDTTRYGKDLYNKYALSDLLEKLATIDAVEWIRVHYYYTEAITDELIDVMAKHKKICSYIDMPIQHINNRILRRMARRTSREEIEEKIEKIRQKMPDVTIRTSIIVGFPGETAEEFDELYEKVRAELIDTVFTVTATVEKPFLAFSARTSARVASGVRLEAEVTNPAL